MERISPALKHTFEFLDSHKVFLTSAGVVGVRVLIACRNKEKGDTALDVIRDFSGNSNIALYISDLNSLEPVGKCAAQINAREQRLDVLINNAGNVLFTITFSGY